MELKLYNTLSRKKEIFNAISDVVGIYSCGPTVYKPAHIGNMRPYIFMDTLRRVLVYNGYKVKLVMNITDVGHLLSDADEGEDKMVKTAVERNKSPYEIAEEITALFISDIKSLNIAVPNVMPRATDNIPEMIHITEALLNSGYAYVLEDGVYFSVEKFDGYGKLSGIRLEDLKSGARVEVNENKLHPSDFALWKKAAPNHIMQWDSPWGKGFPGWHIECTAMSHKYLGQYFDIHTGGIDAVPIHHENEIAQGEAYTGIKNTNYWLHNEFILFDGGKMSKSLGNVYTITDLIKKGYPALAFRYLCLNAHHRQKLNFTFEALDGAKKAHSRLVSLLEKHKEAPARTTDTILHSYKNEFLTAINDDLNIPLALGVLWTMVKEDYSTDIYELSIEFDKVLGLSLDKPVAAEASNIPDNVILLANERLVARKNKNFAESDRLRGEINKLGYNIKDTASGFELTESGK